MFLKEPAMIQKTIKSQKTSEYPKQRLRPTLAAASSKLLKSRRPVARENVLRPETVEETTPGNGQAAMTSPPRQRPSVSIETEQRRVIAAVSQVSRNIRGFQLEHKIDGSDHGKWPKMARELLERVGTEPGEAESCVGLKRLLVESRKKHAKRPPEYGRLEQYCDKCIRFEELVPECRHRLDEVYRNGARKHFSSYGDRAGELVRAARDYDEKIARYEADITATFHSLGDAIERYRQLRVPLVSGMLARVAPVGDLMENCCKLVVSLCDSLRQWTHDDRQYPARLWDEIIANSLQRSRMIEILKKMSRRRQELLRQRHGKQSALDKTAAKLEKAKEEQMKLTSNKENHRSRIEKVRAETSSTLSRLEEINEKFQKRKVNSPCYIESLLRKADDLKGEVRRLESRLAALVRQHYVVDKAEDDQLRLVSDLERELDAQRQGVRSTDVRIASLEASIDGTTRSIAETEAQIVAAKRIRGMKLSSAALRRE